MRSKLFIGVGLTVAALASAAVFAKRGELFSDGIHLGENVRGVSADLPPPAEQHVQTQRPRFSAVAPAESRAARTPIKARLADPIYPVTEDEVYDTDSFGRYVKWLGLTSAYVNLETGCPKPTIPEEYCQEINPTVGGITSFNFQDAARIKLPKGASNSILCYWFSPILRVTYRNVTGGRVVGRLRYSPTLTIENPVLSDPSLIDPTTGLPFGGQLLTSMSSSERFEESLEPGVIISEQSRDSTVCIGGFISHKALINNYGLTPAQADDFFASPTVVRLNISGSAQHVEAASLTLALRVMGD